MKLYKYEEIAADIEGKISGGQYLFATNGFGKLNGLLYWVKEQL